MDEEKTGTIPEAGEERREETPTAAADGGVNEAASAAEKSGGIRKFGELPRTQRLVLQALIAALLVSGTLCIWAFGQYHALKAHYTGALREANEALDAAMAERAEADPASEASAALRRQAAEDMIEEGKEQIAEIERHNAELDEAARELETKIEGLKEIEDYEYYRAIYDEYVEGKAYIEELLAED